VQRLDEVEGLIQSCRDILGKLDELVKSRFVEMFGDPIENSKDWIKMPVGDAYDVGSAKRVYARDQVSEGIPFLRLGDLTNRIQQGVESCDLFISEELYIEHKEKGLVPDAGDILVTARGTMGLCYVVKPEDKFYFQDGMISWLSKYADEITPLYIKYLFDMPGFAKQINSMQAGSTVAYLSISMLKKLDVMLPNTEEQNDFADFVAKVDKSKVAVQAALDKAQLLFDSLIQEYFG
jgi:type I restriction enzyme S subunit